MVGFSPLNDGQWEHFGTGWSNRSAGGNTAICTDVHLPSGAVLESITTYTNDTAAGGNITYELFAFNLATNVGTTPFTFSTSGTPGIQRVLRPVSPAITINNQNNAYALCIFHDVLGTTLQSAGATFWYRLQVSAAPGTATFGDVPTAHPFFQFIEALVKSGITVGCGGGNYCPDNTLTRGEMAVFLSKGLGLHFAP